MNSFKITAIAALSLGLALLFFACEKVAEPETSNFAESQISFEYFYEKYRAKPKKVSFSYDYTLITKNGTKLTFFRNQFRKLNGDTLLGPIDLEIIDLSTKEDMVLFNRPSVSDEYPIESMGFFHLKATQKGTHVHYVGPIAVEVPPAVAKPGILLFLGEQNMADQPNWVVADRSDSSGTWDEEKGYRTTFFPNPELGWINCDRFMNASNTTWIEVITTNDPDPTKTVLFMAFDSINSVMPIYPHVGGRYRLDYAPIGEPVTILAITNFKNSFYYGLKKTVVSDSLVETISFSKISEGALKEVIKDL